MAEAAAWYVALLIVAATGLVPAALLFDRLESRGAFLARPLALAWAALATWLLVRLTPFTYGTVVVVLAFALLVTLSVWVGWRRPALVADLVARWRRIAVAEVLFLLLFVLIVALRAQTPDAVNTEKPADLMLLVAVHRAEEFPPPDPWLSGERISYYHLSHVQMDAVGRLSGNPPEVTFNLATATAGAAAGVAVLGLALDALALSAVRRRRSLVLGGAVALGGLLLAAPLVGPVQILAANGVGGEGTWGWLGVENVPVAAEAERLVPTAFWWWWSTTRVLGGVISEYPAFSILLGDPHPHLLAVPLGVAALTLAVQVLQGGEPLTWRRWLRQPERWLLTSALFSALVMTNSWDVISFGAIWALAAWWAACRTGWPALLAGFIAARWAMVPAALSLLLAWPFLQSLDPAPLGVAPVEGVASDPRWFLVWLPVLLPSLAALLLLRPNLRPHLRRGLPVVLGVAVLPVALWAAWLVGRGQAGEVLARSWGWPALLLLVAGVALAALASTAAEARDRATATGLWLLGAAGALLLATELIHVDDAFAGRLNTAFKFWYHAWVVLAVAGGVLAGRAADRWERRPTAAPVREGHEGGEGARVGTRGGNRAAGVAVMVGVAACLSLWLVTMLTPAAMAVSRSREGQERGLNAIAYLQSYDPALAETVAWARTHLDPEEHVLVQSTGEAYSTGNRLSAASGIPTLLGWSGHERQWRGEIAEPARREALARLYDGTGVEARDAARQWGVTHVYVGREERSAYGPDAGSALSGWPVAFSSGNATVFEAPR